MAKRLCKTNSRAWKVPRGLLFSTGVFFGLLPQWFTEPRGGRGCLRAVTKKKPREDCSGGAEAAK